MKPVLVSCWGRPKKYFGAFLDTAKRVGIEPVNADPGDWGGDDWRTIEWFRKSEAQAKFIREHKDEFSHFCFTDSYDIVFNAGWDEILAKFERLNSPIVFGSECYCWPDINKAGSYPPCGHRTRYLNAGFWMARSSSALIDFADNLATIAARREKCDQGIVTDMFLSSQHPIVLDTASSICFCMNMDSPNFLDMSGPRPRNIDTGEYPCMYHGNGGSDLLTLIRHIAP